ncbi:MAG: MATE family efflux transporter [Labilithrix sp.]|nr:MATE family efflux transporter [Labilithrix sp.]
MSEATSRPSELSAIAKLAAPIVLAQLGLTLLGLVDVAILGHVSATELGGASIGRSIGFVGLALGIGASAALEPLASQAVGAREPHVAWRALLAAIVACTLVWIPCSLVAIGSTWLLAPLGIDPDLVRPARAFLLGQTPGLLCTSIFLSVKTFLQAHERTWPALASAVAANVVNVLVCNALVRGEIPLGRFGTIALGLPPMGALGAGIASSVASAVLVLGVLAAALRMRPARERDARALPIAKVLRLGTPFGLQLLAEIGVFSVVAVLAGRLGEIAVSAHQIAIGLASFTFMGALGISGATAVRVGHAIGERRAPRRAGLVGIAMGAAFMSGSSLLFLVMPRALASLFTDDPRILDLGVTLLGVAAAFQIFDGVQGVAAGALRGAGDVRFAFLANVGAHWFVGFPLALLFGFRLGFGAPGLWWGLLAGLVVISILLAWRFVVVTRALIERV